MHRALHIPLAPVTVASSSSSKLVALYPPAAAVRTGTSSLNQQAAALEAL